MIFPCQCYFYGTTFCGEIENENEIIVLIKIVSYELVNNFHPTINAEVVNDINDQLAMDTIVILGDNGGNCNETVNFPIGDTLLMNLNEASPYFYEENHYDLYGCELHFLWFKNDTLYGDLMPGVDKIAYLNFLEIVDDCLESPKYYGISGKVFGWPEMDKGIEELVIEINGFPRETRFSGTYTFPYVLYEESDIPQQIIIESNHEIKKGVTMLDVIRIRRHILGIERLTTPWELISSDVNNSETISTLDLIQMKRVIMDEVNYFPNNNSWRFVKKGYEFTDNNNPWLDDFEMVTMVTLNENDEYPRTNDFIGIKIGDVDGSSYMMN